jgi:multiple sugar transport system ATP-binding protein
VAGLVLDHVRKCYGNHEVIRDLSLEIHDREFFVILGESGAGKTTILKMIAGVEPVTTGAIFLNNRPIQNRPPEERDCAMVFETYALYPHLSAYENIAFPLRAPGRRTTDAQIEKSVLQAASILGIDPFLDRRPASLSGGQRQRVALGRAMVRQPAVFLMDEPLSHLDARLRNEMRTEIRALRESFGTTIVYVTHDYNEALALGDRIAILHQGRIEQVGSPSQVFRRPINRLVAESLGDPPMNFLAGTIAFDQNRSLFKMGSWRIPLPEMPRLQECADKKVSLGLRPQHLRMDRVRPDTLFSLPSKFIAQELLGDHAVASVAAGDRLIKVFCKAVQDYNPDDTLYLTWDPKNIYLFLEDTGETILAEGD